MIHCQGGNNMTVIIEEFYKFHFKDNIQMTILEDFLDNLSKDGSFEYMKLQFPIHPNLLIERYWDENSIENREVFSYKQPYNDLIMRLEEYITNISSEKGIFYITDNYFFFPSKGTSEDMHIKLLTRLLLKAEHEKIIVILNNQKNVNETMVEKLRETLRVKQIKFDYTINDNFHDRFWLSDRKGGFVLGTSINGLAKRTCLVRRLDFIDYAMILEEIDQSLNIESL